VSYEIIKTVLTEVGLNMDDEEVEGAEKTEEDEKVEFSEKRLKEIAKALKDKGLI
jgi:beta-glucosidase/6-phospho-beta-glucosidase/beta-galactosidase